MAEPAQISPGRAAVTIPHVAPQPVADGRRILFVMRHWGYVRQFEPTIRLLATRGHHLELAFETIHKGDDSPSGIVRRLLHDCPTVSRRTLVLDDEREPWVMVATAVRAALDYLRYAESRAAHPGKVVKRVRKYVHPLVLRLLESRFGRTRPGLAAVGGTLRTFERVARPGSGVGRAIDDFRPDLVVVTPLVSSWRQAEFLSAAHDRGVRCGVCVSSWDNLSTKGSLHGRPDFVTVWNETQRREAIEMHGMADGEVIATGAQNYDHWFTWQPSRSRREFCAEVGLDSSQPYVLYMCSSTFIAGKDEPAAIARWIAQLRASDHPELRRLGVLVRPHPINLGAWTPEALVALDDEAVVWPTTSVDPDDIAPRNDFFDSIYHAAAVFGINTSSLIESAIVGRPVLSLMMPEFVNAQARSIHFSYLHSVGGGILNVAESFEEHASQLASLLREERAQSARREAFLRAFVRPHGLDRPAGPILAAVLEEQAAVEPRRRRPALRTRTARGLLAVPVALAARSLVRAERASPATKKKLRKPKTRSRPRHAQRKSKLTLEQTQLLALMREDNAAAPETFRPSSYWLELGDQFDHWFHEEGIKSVERQSYNALFSTPPGTGRYFHYALWMLYSHVREKDERDVLGRMTRAKLPKTAESLDGHRVNWDVLLSIDTLYSLAELDSRIWSEPVVVADLGSGWGRIGHVLETVNPRAAYVTLDLPEALLVASTVLPRMLPHAPVHGYVETRGVERFTRDKLLGSGSGGGIWFCGSHHLPRFEPRSIDYFVNVASFQEMARSQVAHYLELVGRTSRSLLVQEYRRRPRGLGEPIIGGLDEYEFDRRWEQRYLRPVFFSQDFFEAGFVIPEQA